MLALPVLILAVGALVILLLALTEAKPELGPAFAPVERQRDKGVAFAVHGTAKAVYFLPVQQ